MSSTTQCEDITGDEEGNVTLSVNMNRDVFDRKGRNNSKLYNP